MRINLLALIFIFLPIILFSQKRLKPTKLKPENWISIKVSEPSDIAYNQDKNTFYVASDDGYLAEMDMDGKIIRKAAYTGYDFEGVLLFEDKVYVVDEMTRKVVVYDEENLEKLSIHSVPYPGGRNKSYESLAFNYEKNTFILITEKEPIYIYELNDKFHIINEIEFKYKVSDISSARFHNGFMWLLSDENMELLKCNPSNYEVLESYKLPVINPEGVAFVNDTDFVILSDDMERMYFFKLPHKLN